MKTTICQCAWIDGEGNPTPDNFEAIALAVCHDPRTFGEKGCDPFPICERHADKKGKFWKLLPLPGQSLEEAHLLVQRDNREFRIIPDLVVESVKQAFTKQANDILDSLQWSGDHFSFVRWGIYVGVEHTGYGKGRRL